MSPWCMARAFGMSPYVRISYATDDRPRLMEACRRIARFCAGLHMSSWQLRLIARLTHLWPPSTNVSNFPGGHATLFRTSTGNARAAGTGAYSDREDRARQAAFSDLAARISIASPTRNGAIRIPNGSRLRARADPAGPGFRLPGAGPGRKGYRVVCPDLVGRALSDWLKEPGRVRPSAIYAMDMATLAGPARRRDGGLGGDLAGRADRHDVGRSGRVRRSAGW